VRVILASLVWLLDLALKLALGGLLAFLICRPLLSDAAFGVACPIAGGLIGLCLLGFFEGCDFILLGLAKRVGGER
jgi:hypothetical protein